ncbi:hypothetical protein BD779DRAFT_1758299 [Infundibulicybe gibba]|nr:hypothetical protein BD779DRAFT_1758299 [Infundibulicybe gibba]
MYSQDRDPPETKKRGWVDNSQRRGAVWPVIGKVPLLSGCEFTLQYYLNTIPPAKEFSEWSSRGSHSRITTLLKLHYEQGYGVPVYSCIVVANSVEEYEDMPGLGPVEFGEEAATLDGPEYEDMPELEMADSEAGDGTASQNIAIAWYGQATHIIRGNTYRSGSCNTLMFPDFEALIVISEHVQPRRFIRPPAMSRIAVRSPRIMHWLMQVLYDNNALFYCEVQGRRNRTDISKNQIVLLHVASTWDGNGNLALMFFTGAPWLHNTFSRFGHLDYTLTDGAHVVIGQYGYEVGISSRHRLYWSLITVRSASLTITTICSLRLLPSMFNSIHRGAGTPSLASLCISHAPRPTPLILQTTFLRLFDLIMSGLPHPCTRGVMLYVAGPRLLYFRPQWVTTSIVFDVDWSYVVLEKRRTAPISLRGARSSSWPGQRTRGISRYKYDYVCWLLSQHSGTRFAVGVRSFALSNLPRSHTFTGIYDSNTHDMVSSPPM